MIPKLNTKSREPIPTPHFPTLTPGPLSSTVHFHPIRVSRILRKPSKGHRSNISSSHNSSPARPFQFKENSSLKLPPLKPLLHVVKRKEQPDLSEQEKRFHKRVSSLPFIIHGSYCT